MDPEARQCPHCGKKLRANNTKGVCADCSARGRTLENAPATPDASLYDVKAPSESRAKPKAEPPETKHALPAMERFRIVADALGEDADKLLEAFAESWLAQLKERVASED